MPITPRSSPSAQNPGPGSGGPVPQNQMVPQAAGNPRYKPGIGPDPNPRVVVKAVNPPVTPDQVVSMAEIPEAATIELPKIQNIKIAPVKNKTIQGHLKAIEAKMIATEKLMKDVVKLQKVQIHTEKELFERKRELYQNTFEEYLLDKTIDFEDPENPDCTCVNLPKKGGPGGGFLPNRRRRRGRGRNRQPSTAPAPSTVKEPATKKGPATIPGTTPPLQPNQPKEEEKSPQQYPEGYPAPNPIDLIRIFGDFKKFWDLITDPGLGPVTAIPQSSPLAFNRDPGLEEFLRSGEFDPASQAAAPAITPEEATRQLNEEIDGQQSDYGGTFTPIKKQPLSPDPPQPSFADSIASSAFSLYNQFENFRGAVNDTPLMKAIEPYAEGLNNAMNDPTISIGMGLATGGANQGLQGIKIAPNLFARMFPQQYVNMSKFFARARAGASVADDIPAPVASAADDAVVTITGSADDVAATATSTAKTPVTGGGMTARQRALMRGGSRGPQRGRGTSRLRGNQDKLDERRVDRLIEQLDNQSTPGNIKSQIDRTSLEETLRRPSAGGTGSRVVRNKDGWETNVGKRASGGMGDVELFNSDALNYFRGMSSKIIPMASGGFMTTNEKAEYYMERLLNQALGVARRYDEAKAKAADVQTTTGSVVIPKSGGGLVGWWNKGRNMRVPSENTASWKDLMKDDAKQITRTNKAFKSGATGIKGWNPIKAFTPEMVRTGPTPAVRQAFERPARTVTHPLMMALEFIVNDLLLNPRSTAVYDQVTGPNAYYNDPAYKGPMPSQNLENAQSSMMSGNNDQKPELVPLPPEYIKIPGKNKATDFVGDNSPDIEMKPSIFSRSSTHID